MKLLVRNLARLELKDQAVAQLMHRGLLIQRASGEFSLHRYHSWTTEEVEQLLLAVARPNVYSALLVMCKLSLCPLTFGSLCDRDDCPGKAVAR